MISNLQITNEIILVAWQLVTQRYNNKRLIAMMHAKHLCQKPQVRNGDASSLRQLVNHVSCHMNALQAFKFNVRVQDLMLNHLIQPHSTLKRNESGSLSPPHVQILQQLQIWSHSWNQDAELLSFFRQLNH